MAEFEEINCPICESDSYSAISSKGRDYIKTHIAICDHCGFVYQNPRWSKERIGEFYRTEYDKYYRSGFTTRNMSEEAYAKYKFGFAPLLERIRPHLSRSSDLRILDIGAGDGTNVAFLGKQLSSSDLFAIEPSEEGSAAIKHKGISYIGPDVDADWQGEFQTSFDLVVLRHVFEHLHYPNDFLKRIRGCLKPDGLLYIAVPDVYNIGRERLQREFFRVVHNYYFSERSLGNMLRKHGFEILSLKAGDAFHDAELFAVVRQGQAQGAVDADITEKDRQMAYLQPIMDAEAGWQARLGAMQDYCKRRLYLLKVKMKGRLGIG